MWNESSAAVFRRKPHTGFTLIELLITLAILALLATLALPTAQVSAQRVQEAELRRNLREIRDGINAYKRAYDQGRVERKTGATGYPPKLELLEEGVEDVRDPKRNKMYFLRRVPRDPFFPNPDVPAVNTWGKRSYASGPDEPKEGDDVFDVYSLSVTPGLNGVAYRKW